MPPSPIIAIVGRPNVGKSSLFNRLIGKRQAITAKEAGTTRDRIIQKWSCNGHETLLIDTGGLEYGKQESIEADIQSQANIAIGDADLILFVVDTIDDLTSDDFSAADILRKSQKPAILVANKCEQANIEEKVFNILELGFGEPIQVSAIHNLGIDALKNDIEKALKKLKFKKQKKTTDETDKISLSIIGKPNAGKSSLVNALTNSEKVIVSEIPGTTRDMTDTELSYKDQEFVLTDTAGLRRPGKIQRGIEKFSSLRVISAIEKSEIIVLLIDGVEGPTHQDCHIAQLALEAKKGVILAINKSDLLDGDAEKSFLLRKLQRKFSFIPWTPVIFVSAKNKKNTYKILELANKIMEERKKRISTAELNTFLQKTCFKHLPASAKNKKPKFFYGSQVAVCPPTFTLFFKNPKNLHFSYPRYLENEIRKKYGFDGTAIELKFKAKSEERKI